MQLNTCRELAWIYLHFYLNCVEKSNCFQRMNLNNFGDLLVTSAEPMTFYGQLGKQEVVLFFFFFILVSFQLTSSSMWPLPPLMTCARYHCVFDHRVAPSLVVFRDVGAVAVGTVKTALHIVTIVTQHPEDHLTHTHTGRIQHRNQNETTVLRESKSNSSPRL